MATTSAYTLGTDIFSIRKPSDWNLLVDAGVKFILIKASQNTRSIEGFQKNWKKAKGVGLLRGAFHFLQWEQNNIKEQANYFIKTVGADKGELPPVLDLENIYQGDKSVKLPARNIFLIRVKEWLDHVERAFGKKPIVYTNLPFIEKYLIKAPWINDYLFWPAMFPYKPGTQITYNDPNKGPTDWPLQIEGIKPWVFWHWSGDGRIKGFPPNQTVDLHYFKGSYDNLLEFTKTSTLMVTPTSVSDVEINRPRKPRLKDKKKIDEIVETVGTLGYKEIDKNPSTDSDRPSGIDRLNYSQYAEQFARIILNPETSTPLTIGIYGQWGQGKSFLMGKIKDAIAAESKKQKDTGKTVDYHIVNFNAWAYVGTDHLWAGLVNHLYQEAEEFFKLQLHVNRLWQAIKKSLPKSLIIFAFYALLGLGLSILLHYPDIEASWKALTRAFGITVMGGSALAGLPLLWTTLKEFIDNLFLTRSKSLQNLAARPDFRSQIGIMADIKKEVHFISSLLMKGKRGRLTRFILFIDDLDRCEHRKAVEVLQAIMLLLTDEDAAPFIIFMGIDARVIVRAIEATYGEVLVKSGINGYEYLDKIVQIPFSIPPAKPDEIKNYVKSMLMSDDEKAALAKAKEKAVKPITPPPEEKEQPPADGSEQAGKPDTGSKLVSPTQPTDLGKQTPPDASDTTTPELPQISLSFKESEQTALEECTNDLTNNPRKIKRIINIYRFARLILPEAQDRTKAIRWFLMTEQWPLHVAWIREYIENDEQTVKALKNKTITDVYKLVKKYIHSESMETLLGIDADPEIFEKYIKDNNFSVLEIKDLLPYTFNLNPAVNSEVTKQMIRLTEINPKPKAIQKKPAITLQSA